MLKYALILMCVTLAASGALGFVNQLTQPKIAAQKQLELQKGLSAVLPGTADGIIVPDEENAVYRGYANQDTSDFRGIAFSSFAKGYSSTIWTLVGLDSNGTVMKIRVLGQQETPGLGTKCMEIRSGESEPWWQAQFEGKFAPDLRVDKDGGEIVSITGATITSRAITNDIAARSGTIIEKLKMTE